MDIQGKGWKGMNWINLVHDRDMWQAVLNKVINNGVTYSHRDAVFSVRCISLVIFTPSQRNNERKT